MGRPTLRREVRGNIFNAQAEQFCPAVTQYAAGILVYMVETTTIIYQKRGFAYVVQGKIQQGDALLRLFALSDVPNNARQLQWLTLLVAQELSKGRDDPGFGGAPRPNFELQ